MSNKLFIPLILFSSLFISCSDSNQLSLSNLFNSNKIDQETLNDLTAKEEGYKLAEKYMSTHNVDGIASSATITYKCHYNKHNNTFYLYYSIEDFPYKRENILIDLLENKTVASTMLFGYESNNNPTTYYINEQKVSMTEYTDFVFACMKN